MRVPWVETLAWIAYLELLRPRDYAAPMTDLIAANILSFCLGAVICAFFFQQLHFRAYRKHYAELEALRGKHAAESDALAGRPRIVAMSPGQPVSPYYQAYNTVGLAELLKKIQQEHDLILRRLDQLERDRKSGVA